MRFPALRAGAARVLEAALALALAAALPPAAYAADPWPVTAVLSDELSPYQRAYQGFLSALGGRPVDRYTAAEYEKASAAKKPKLLVAFGGRAAGVNPGKAMRVICLAPSVDRVPEAGAIYVEMLPDPETMVARIRQVQPGLGVLVAFWASEFSYDYIMEMAAAGKRAGLEVRAYRTDDGGELSAALRTGIVVGSAIWIPPDARLINSENFDILRRYSAQNSVPLYVPTEGLVKNGGTVSISAGFEEIGRMAGETALLLAEGRFLPGTAYPRNVEVTINSAMARQCGIETSKLKLPGLKFHAQ